MHTTSWLLIFLTAGLLLALSACGSDGASGNHEPAATAGMTSRADESRKAALRATATAERPSGTAEVEIVTAGPEEAAPYVTAAAERPSGTEAVEIVTAEPEESAASLIALDDLRDAALPASVGETCESCTGEYGWKITFEDDFDGESLDTSRWDTGYKAGDQEAQYYVDDVFEVEDGILKIRAEERQVEDRHYASGILTTQGIFDQRYGLFEVRAKVPAGQGLWPAFWLLPTSKNYPLEIDVFEVLGHEPDTAYLSSHWPDENGEHVYETRGFKGPDFSEDFHTYAVYWSSEEIVWLVDGVERARETRGIPQEPMFMLLNLAVGGEWPGYPDETTPFPSYLEVDYVRTYTLVCRDGFPDEMEKE